jgi:hypothetical protein
MVASVTHDKIPKEHLEDWLRDPITKKVMSILRETRSDFQDSLITGQTLSMQSCEATALQTSLLLGKISGLNIILEFQIED